MPRCLRLVRRFLAPVAARGAASLGAARVSSLRQAQRPSRLSAVASASHWTRRSARGFRSSAFVALDEKRGEEGRQGDEDDKQVEEFEDFEEEEDDEDGESANEAETENAAAKEYLGVVYNATKIKKYSAELELDGHIISGGDYWTALDAARAYDELVDLYCDLDTPRNFASTSSEDDDTVGDYDDELSTSESEWETPEVGKRHADIIPPIPQTYLTLEEVTDALEREKAIDVYTVDLEGKSSLADYMIFTTGRSQAHMRRMADLLIRSMKARRLDDDFDYAVEGRDCDDWMIADCNNIVVHFLREDTRRILNLEDHWENMVDDKHRIYGDMTEDEYMDKFGTSELMEYLEDDDFAVEDGGDDEEESAKRAKRRARRQTEQGEKEDDLDWK